MSRFVRVMFQRMGAATNLTFVADDDRGAGRRADRCIRPGGAVPQRLPGQCIDVRTLDIGISITTELLTIVLGGDPEDIRTFLRRSQRHPRTNQDAPERVSQFIANISENLCGSAIKTVRSRAGLSVGGDPSIIWRLKYPQAFEPIYSTAATRWWSVVNRPAKSAMCS